MKLKITKDGTIHRGDPKAAGEIVSEDDKNHVGGLMCAGAILVKGDEKPEPAPEPPKNKVAKKKAAPKKSDD